MTNNINPDLLNNTLNLIQLARETALAKGNQAQASRLSPVVQDLRSMVTAAPASSNTVAAAPSEQMQQGDFKTLLSVVKTGQKANAGASGTIISERNQMVVAMANGKMNDVDIARQMGMTREEVQMVLSLNQQAKGVRR